MTTLFLAALFTSALAWRIISRRRRHRREQERRRRLRDQPTDLQRWAADHWHPRHDRRA
jgi:hypothetical protein